MTYDDGLADRAFGVIRLPARPAKPRDTGLTVVADKGLGPQGLEDLLAMAADHVDWLKVAGSTARLHRPAVLAAKIAQLHEADVQVLLAGDVLELGVVQGVAGRVYAQAAELGFDAVEVASAQTVISPRDKAELVRRAAARGLQVFGEVGRKGGGGSSPDAATLAHEAQLLVDAGASRVLLQGEGLLEGVGQIAEDVLLGFAARVDIERTVLQAKESRAQGWLVETFGPHVSVDIDAASVLSFELLRRGARQRGLLGTVATVEPHG